MGTYTELQLSVELKKETLNDCFNHLYCMVNGLEYDLPRSDHPFFTDTHAKQVMTGTSAYFTHPPYAKLQFDARYSQSWNFSCRSNLKNYSKTYQKFLHWIAPFVDEGYEHEPQGWLKVEDGGLYLISFSLNQVWLQLTWPTHDNELEPIRLKDIIDTE